jgi:GTP-binding protein YchF
MGFKCGIVGLPNVGKSSFFNALTKSDVPSENYPFCTIDANSAMVEVRDKRLKSITKLVQPQKTIYSSAEFVDIAGLVAGASKGEGLGNKFLANIREVDAILHMLRCFDSEDIQHVEGRIDPIADKEIINFELQLKDLESIEKRLEKSSKLAKNGDKTAKKENETLEKIKSHISQGINIRDMDLEDDEKLILKPSNLLTIKPIFYVANIDEKTLKGDKNPHLEAVKALAAKEKREIAAACTTFEEELSQLGEEDQKLFLEEYGLIEPTINDVIKIAYSTLGYISYFTAGEKEVRSWAISKGATAPQAAGAIHSDFEKKFIRAEVISYDSFIQYKSELECKKAGKIAVEGKNYIVKDGDIIHFLTNA